MFAALRLGISASFAGLKIAYREPTVHRTYWRLVFALLAITAVLDVAGIWSLFHFTDWTADTNGWVIAGMVVARVVGTLALCIVAPIVAVLMVNIVLPFFGQGPFMAGMRTMDPELAAHLEAGPGRPMLLSAGLALLRLGIFIALFLLSFLLALVPAVGPVLVIIAQLVITARAVTWELIDPYFDRLGHGWDEQRRFLRKHRGAIIGFGLPIAVVMSVPLLGPLIFVLAQAAAPKLLIDVLAREAALAPAPVSSYYPPR